MITTKTLLFTFFATTFCVKVEASSSNCTCVPFYLCSDEDNHIITDGRDLLDVRQTKPCAGVFEVCCNTTLPTSTLEPLTAAPRGCGLQDPSSYQWSASLLFKQYPYFVPSYRCRISLIHPQVALTAAHCLEEKGFYLVRISSSIRPVAQTVVHPFYKPATLQNDVAILILNKPFKMEKATTVCVPPPGMVLDGLNCTAATRVRDDSEELKIISLPTVSREECVESLRKTRLGKFFQLHQSFLCAGGDENRDTCGGDGGSPLICPVPGVPGRFQQVGIVSWGIGCGGGVPGVYVNLAQFREFIDEVMHANGLDSNSYRL